MHKGRPESAARSLIRAVWTIQPFDLRKREEPMTLVLY